MKNSNYIIFDLETGGLKPDTNAITEYAGIVVEPKNLQIIDKLQFYIKPYEMEYDKIAEKVTGITQKKLKREGIKYETAMKAIMKQFNNSKTGGRGDKGFPTLVGHNVAFDIGFLEFNFEVMGHELKDYVKLYHEDTMWSARKAFQMDKDTALNLGAVCTKLGISLDNAHSAMDDVVASYEVFKHFMSVMRNTTAEASDGAKKEYPQYQF